MIIDFDCCQVTFFKKNILNLAQAMKDSPIKGVKCPYANIQPELNECTYSNFEASSFYFITPEQMIGLNIVNATAENADPQLMRIDEIEKLRSEIIENSIHHTKKNYIVIRNLIII